jgi:NAD(P)-dependent dehydrogenase (short-subunit alcohol dehydrogenase family)
MSSLQSRVIAITGSASGIGLATAHLLASHSAILCLADLNAPLLETAEREIKQKFPAVQVLCYVLDVRKEVEVKKWIEGIVDTHGRLDGAVNLAGVIGE